MQTNESDSLRTASWPVVDGSYIVSDPLAPVAVCVLTTGDELLQPLAKVPGVALVGQLYTSNIGIEHIVLNITTNPMIRFLLLCGKESRIFQPAQSLRALLEYGVDQTGTIVNAQGYNPVLRNLSPQHIDTLRRQIELVDRCEERDLAVLTTCIQELAARSPRRFLSDPIRMNASEQPEFIQLRPGGRREPLSYDPNGYFVISLDRAEGLIIVHRYSPDHTPLHEMRGRTAESILLGLLREGLVSQLSHAGYLGAELAKAESALRLGIHVRYEQDRPLKRQVVKTAMSTEDGQPPKSAPAASMTWERLKEEEVGQPVDAAMEVNMLTEAHVLDGIFLEPGAADPLRTFRRTSHRLHAYWSSDTQVVMGKPEHFEVGALLRVIGTLRSPGEIEANQIAVMTRIVNLLPDEGVE